MIMKFVSSPQDWVSDPCDALVVALDDQWASRPEFQALDRATSGWFGRAMHTAEVSTKPNKVSILIAPPGMPTGLLAIVGTGSTSTTSCNTYYRAAGSAMRSLASKQRSVLRFVGFGNSPLETRAAIAGAMVGAQGQDLYKSDKSTFSPNLVQWFGANDSQIRAGEIVGESVNLARHMVNQPPNLMYPQTFAHRANEVANDAGFSVEVWDKDRLEQERCGALLAVARGSIREPRLLILRYQGSTPDSDPLALVGKGVTFDSGGYSLKPTDGMLTMKCDMAGAATVLGIFNAVAKLKVRRNLIGVVGLVENLVSGDAFKLGDVLTARSGKTIEIHNTDAEGRLVLADCLNVALQENPTQIIDFATLTGACVVALGNDVAGLMSNNNPLQGDVQSFTEKCGELTWPLPMHSFYGEQIAGKVADIKNVGEGRWGGAITAAKFLEEFVQARPWVHLDIAGPSFLDSPKPWCDAGGTGFLVRSFAEWLLA
jgi:leucyl aminopeptidase